MLKKRESRLKREHDGLKSLIGGLVGGPALLKEWEREWRERFGGEEADEVEGDEAAAGSDDEDGDGEDSDGEDEDGRARKKAKFTKAPKKEKAPKPAPPPPVPTVPGAVPEKRKRGRPRKIPLPPAVPATTMTPMEGVVPVIMPQSHVPMQQDFVAQPPPQSGQQYLLAVFAFFSFFNSPMANNYSRGQAYPDAHAHHGSVLTTHHAATPPITVPRSGYGTQELIQAFHLLVSTLVFFYVVFPWLSGVMKKSTVLSRLVYELRRFSSRHDEGSKATVSAPSAPLTSSDKRATLLNALSPCNRGTPQEAIQLRKALGVTSGVFGLMQSVIKAARIDRGLEMNQLEQRAWVRLGELVAFDGRRFRPSLKVLH